MNKENVVKFLLAFLGSLVLSGFVAVLADFMLAWKGWNVSAVLFLSAWIILNVVFAVMNRKRPKRVIRITLRLAVILAVIGAGLFFSWKFFLTGSAYEQVDQGKESLYGGKKVMVIVPHQGDEISLMGGVLEEYIRYGSQVYPVFITNSDAVVDAEQSHREALEVFERLGIPADQAIFLGYGEAWKEGSPHIYNAEGGIVAESTCGRTATYGTRSHIAWRKGMDYTAENLLEDIQSVVKSYRPDVIYCVDYDIHINHKAASLAFDKALGRILLEDAEYRPQVFKGYVELTARNAEADFFTENILSTPDMLADAPVSAYRWEDRVRLPVGGGTLSRSLVGTESYAALNLYGSRDNRLDAARVINGDKVFWYRDTNSLCYQAEIEVTSGDGMLLNDFMLYDNADLANRPDMPCDGVWIPEGEEKEIKVSFGMSRDVGCIRLYDNPSPMDNVLAGRIEFSNGGYVEFGPLEPNGMCTTVPIEHKYITGFKVILTETQGEKAGLTEIEAFEQEPVCDISFVKIMDAAGNFVYDYWIPQGSEADLSVYTYGISEQSIDRLNLQWDNQSCWAQKDRGTIGVVVPEGKSMKLTISVEGSFIYDTVYIRNPDKLTRLHCAVSQALEEQLMGIFCEGTYRNSGAWKLLSAIVGPGA